MNNSDLQNMIEKYKEELLKYAKENGGYVSDDVINNIPVSDEAVPAAVNDIPQLREPEEITELVGTNPDNYNAGRNEPTYRNLEEFKAENTGEGTMKIQAFTGRESFPIVNARAVISKDFTEGTHVFYDEMTDISGIIDPMRLSAPPSENAKRTNEAPVLSTYTVKVTHPYYITTVYKNVPVFDGVMSIQPVNMVPKTGTPTDDNEIVIVEQEPKDL